MIFCAPCHVSNEMTISMKFLVDITITNIIAKNVILYNSRECSNGIFKSLVYSIIMITIIH